MQGVSRNEYIKAMHRTLFNRNVNRINDKTIENMLNELDKYNARQFHNFVNTSKHQYPKGQFYHFDISCTKNHLLSIKQDYSNTTSIIHQLTKSVQIFFYFFVGLFIYFCIFYLFIYFSFIFLFVYLFIFFVLIIYLFVCLFVHLFIYLFIYLLIYLTIYLFF